MTQNTNFKTNKNDKNTFDSNELHIKQIHNTFLNIATKI